MRDRLGLYHLTGSVAVERVTVVHARLALVHAASSRIRVLIHRRLRQLAAARREVA